MKTLSHFTLAAMMTAALLLAALAASGTAQEGKGKKYETTRFSGKVRGMKGAILEVESAERVPYLVQVGRGTQTTVTGKADVEWVRRGMLVSFKAVLDKRARPKGEVGSLSVVTASREVKPSVKVDSELGGELSNFSFLGEKKAGKKEGDVTIHVVGQVRAIGRGKMTVATPAGALQVAVADNAAVSLAVNDPRLIQQNSDVEVWGRVVRPPQGGQAGQVLGQRLTVRLAEPLSGKRTKKSDKKD